MSQLVLEFFEDEFASGFKLLKSKNEQPCGDNNCVGQTSNFSFIINCDGVSSTSSPSKSSKLLIEKFESHFNSLNSKKPRLGKITEILVKTNKEYLKKDLASTFDLFVYSKKFNYYLGLGDSSFYIFNPDGTILFQNWIHNQSKIIEDHFGTTLGDDNILVNCIGIHHPRFEIAENIKFYKNSNFLFHSDGLEQYFDSPEKIRNFCEKILVKDQLDLEETKTKIANFFANNSDDLSIVYVKTKI